MSCITYVRVFQGRRDPGKTYAIYSKSEQEMTLFVLIPDEGLK